jgi:hypothetical protein
MAGIKELGKSQIPNDKFQINFKSRTPMTETNRLMVSNLNHWSLFGIWGLLFGVFGGKGKRE